MCNKKNHEDCLNPVNCVVPPYIGDKLMKSNNEAVAKKAINSELQSTLIRTQRRFIAGLDATQRNSILPTAKISKAAPTLKMRVYNLKRSTDLSKAVLVWKDGSAVTSLDKDAKNVIYAGKGTWDFYYSLFGRNSIDNLGMIMDHYIHYDKNLENAMWDGSVMVYGDGDGKIFGSFTSDADIIGHELTHGVTQYESDLEYHNQSGALNESLSDVFGIMIKQRLNNQTAAKSNWLIGENVLLGKKYALRSMKSPGKAYVNHPDLGTDPQPATMKEFVHLPDTRSGDWGGVHYNSGIPNFAFYLTAKLIGGYSWEKAGQIWYKASTGGKLKSNASFVEFKVLTIESAEKLYGISSKEAKAVKDAWKETKV